MKAIKVAKPKPPVQFARVAESDAPAIRSAVVLQSALTNGRRAELGIGDVPRPDKVLDRLVWRA